MAANPDFIWFADQLLASVPKLSAKACEQAHGQLQSAALANAADGERQHTLAVLQLTQRGPRGLAAALSAALREQLREELSRPQQAETSVVDAPSLDSLMLVDDAQIEEDIEVARVIQQVDTAAEADLRDLQPMLARLRGVEHATTDLHPMRPEVCARALVRALQQVGLEREARRMALRVVGRALAELLQAAYRSQLSDLRRRGVQPIAYKLRVAPDAAAAGSTGDGAIRQLAGRMKSSPEQTAAQLIPRLLAQVAEQAGLDDTLRRLLARLAEPAIRSTQASAGVLASFEHPVWQLVDRLAALASVQSGQAASSARLVARLEPIVARLERMDPVSPLAFEQALSDVDDLASSWADALLTDAGVLAGPDRTEPGGSAPTDWGGASLPTVPMALGADQANAQLQQWWQALREGQRLRIFLHARWTTLRIVGCTRNHVLLGQRDAGASQTLSRRALLQLREQGLATTLDTAGAVRQAVDTLTLDLDPPA